MKLHTLCFASAALLVHVGAFAGLVTLDFDTPSTGSNIIGTPLVTGFGTITAAGAELVTFITDPEFNAAGASGNKIDHLGGVASLDFSFDVSQVGLIFGGNAGDITIRVLDAGNAILDSFFQPSTGDGEFAGPINLSGLGIRRLEWFETSGSFAGLDNIAITTASVPEPATYGLVALGALAGLFARRRREEA